MENNKKINYLRAKQIAEGMYPEDMFPKKPEECAEMINEAGRNTNSGWYYLGEKHGEVNSQGGFTVYGDDTFTFKYNGKEIGKNVIYKGNTSALSELFDLTAELEGRFPGSTCVVVNSVLYIANHSIKLNINIKQSITNKIETFCAESKTSLGEGQSYLEALQENAKNAAPLIERYDNIEHWLVRVQDGKVENVA